MNGTGHDAIGDMKIKAERTSANLQQEFQSSANVILGSLQDMATPISKQAEAALDQVVPPQQRAALWDQIKAFMVLHPLMSVSCAFLRPKSWACRPSSFLALFG